MNNIYADLNLQGQFIYNNNASNGYILTTDSNGVASWTSSSSTSYYADAGLTFSGSTFSLSSVNNKIIYVSPTIGNDSNSGLNQFLPKLTLKVARDQATSGDTVFVLPGTFTFDNTGGAYNLILDDLNLWKNGVTYYWSPGTKVQISNLISSTQNTIYFFKPSGLAFETCTSIGHLEYTQTTTGGPPAYGAIFYFYDYNTTSGYTFYSQTKSQIGYSNEIINIQRDLTSTSNISTVTIISDYEKVIHSPQMAGTGAGNYIGGGDNTLIFNSYVRERYYGALYSFGLWYNFTKSTINFFGETMTSTYGNSETSSKIIDLRYTSGIININIKQIKFFESASNSNATGLYSRSGNEGILGGYIINIKGDIIETSNIGSANAIFRVDTASNIINYEGNIYINNGSTSRLITYIISSSTLNMKGDIIFGGTSSAASNIILQTNSTATINYEGRILGNFTAPISKPGTGNINIHNSYIKSTVNGTSSSIVSAGTSLGNLRILNSYINMSNSYSPMSNGNYVDVIVNNSTLINTGTSSCLYNNNSNGSLQLLNSQVMSDGLLSIDYLATVNSYYTITNATYSIPNIVGTVSTIYGLKY